MGFKLPDDEKVMEAVRRAFGVRKTMCSQRELREMVVRELGKIDPGLTVSGPRLRRAVLTSGVARVEIFWRETDKRRARSRCPVCGSQLRATKNETVFGGTVTLGFRCPVCPFSSSIRGREPSRYLFTRKDR